MNIFIDAIDFQIIPLTLLFAVIIFPVIRNISNLLTKLGTYHKNEKWLVRIQKLYHTYLLLSISVSGTVFILLSQNIKPADTYDIILISIGSSFMIPLLGRICSLSKRTPPYDCEWGREKERILSFIFSLIIGALTIAVLLFLYRLTFDNALFELTFSSNYTTLFAVFITIITTPIHTAVIGESILRFTGIDEALKI